LSAAVALGGIEAPETLDPLRLVAAFDEEELVRDVANSAVRRLTETESDFPSFLDQ
jgi:hypothetical protein